MVVVSNILLQTSFYNGLLLICASNIGDSLKIPDSWPKEQAWSKSSNALFIDFRGFNADDLDTIANIYLIDHPMRNYKQIVQAVLEIPKRQLYIGDSVKQSSKIIPTPKDKMTIIVYYDRPQNQDNVDIYIQMTEPTS